MYCPYVRHVGSKLHGGVPPRHKNCLFGTSATPQQKQTVSSVIQFLPFFVGYRVLEMRMRTKAPANPK